MEDHSTLLLSLLAVSFIHVLLAMAVLQAGRLEPRWVLLYVLVAAFYGAAYVRRRLWLRHRRVGALHRGLGYVAVVLGASLSVLFFHSIGPGMPLSLALCIWLGLVIAAYFFYRVIVLPLEEPAVTILYL